MGLQYYYTSILSLLPSLSYALVETETMLRDTNCILATWFLRKMPLTRMPTASTRYLRDDARFAAMQPKHREALRDALHEEYRIRDMLRAHRSLYCLAPVLPASGPDAPPN